MSEKLTIDRVLEAAVADKHLGFCTRCGTEAEGVEPDARKYTCFSCGAASLATSQRATRSTGTPTSNLKGSLSSTTCR